jgi:hypothetical protein
VGSKAEELHMSKDEAWSKITSYKYDNDAQIGRCDVKKIGLLATCVVGFGLVAGSALAAPAVTTERCFPSTAPRAGKLQPGARRYRGDTR